MPRRVTRYYAISHDEELGPMWMNQDNLKMCIDGTCFKDACQVTDVTEHILAMAATDENAIAKIISIDPASCPDGEHNWVSAVNEVIESGEFCTKCNLIR